MLPRVTIDPDPQVPVWGLLTVLTLTAGLVAALAATGVAQNLFAAALVVAVAVRPSGPAPALLAMGVGLLLLIGGPIGSLIHVLVFLVHVVVHLTAIVDTLPRDARVEWRVITRSAGRFLAVQAFAQALAVIGSWVSGTALGGSGVQLAAGLALAGLAIAVLAGLAKDTPEG